jgi:2-hydroxy-3-oxopropionate reductase
MLRLSNGVKEDETTLRIGFIGLGIMGKPMAGHLTKAGGTLYVHSRTSAAVETLAALGAIPCKTPEEVAARSEIVFLMLPDTRDVERVLFGPDGVSRGIKPGSAVVDMSSISPLETRRFAERLRGQGVEMLDAPVSGGQIGAQNATLSIMVGGRPEVFERVRPLFEKMGKNIVHIGGNGDGQICKVANQIVVALTIEAVGEALLLASKAGADVVKVREALLGGFAQSRILDVHGERMIKRTFQPGFRIKLHEKDLRLALETGKELGVSLPNTATAQELFTAVSASDGSDLDHAAMVKALERLANFRIGEK